MASSGSSYRIEPLRSDNYDTWRIHAQALLRRAGVLDFVTGKKKKPEEPDRGSTVIFKKNSAQVIDEIGRTVMEANKSENGLYYIRQNRIESCHMTTEIELMHRKLGHISESTLQQARKNEKITGLDFNPNEPLGDCETCIQEAEDIEETSVPRSRYGRPIRPPVWTKDYDMSYLADADEHCLESTENMAIWSDAIKAEIRAHVKNGTWEITKLPANRNLVTNRMILKEKLHPDGTLDRRKARLVARGFTQRPGIDYAETYSPVVRQKSLRLLMGIAAEENLHLSQLDVTTAYLNGTLDEEIYMEKPANLKTILHEILIDESQSEDKTIFLKTQKMLDDLKHDSTEKVCLLKKALYGLKQAGRQWYKRLDTRLKEIGFEPSFADPCIYISGKGGDRILVAVYVDDIIIASSDKEKTENLKMNLTQTFEMRDIGELKYCLGIEFQRLKDGSISMNQLGHIEKLIEKFGMNSSKITKTPMEINLKLEFPEDKTPANVPYQSLIGSLNFLATCTRPDIAYAVSYLSQFNSCYKNEHWLAAKRVLRYLKGTKTMGLKFKKSGIPIFGHSDANWGNCADGRSYTGFCFTYAGSVISWEAKKQRTVAQSTAESEYMALTESAKEALHLKNLANDVGIPTQSIIVHTDNQAAQSWAKNPIVNSKSKHIAIKEHFIRTAVEKNDVCLKYCPTDEMTADIFTKPLAGPKFFIHREKLGLTISSS
ncbi:Hydra magnipapillata [Nesidiocoris tenuis]|uniref:Hydra magnipapillata n=1 Tax=Nesidiocoris tenuis TaxID=355587 RepID=A0ABN7AYT1_9HEMI|nr:Hydra magnipapillata [Nesidiocoris tenuis]